MPSLKKPAIVLAPYGSLSTRALATYERMRKAYELEFPGTLVRLAFTSRLMIKRLREKEGITVASPLEALAELHSSGCRSVVIQSLQIVPGSEFHLLASLVQDLTVHGAEPDFERLEIGLPLLSSLEDCRQGLQSPARFVERLRLGRRRERRGRASCRASPISTRKRMLCFWRATAQAIRRMPSTLLWPAFWRRITATSSWARLKAFQGYLKWWQS